MRPTPSEARTTLTQSKSAVRVPPAAVVSGAAHHARYARAAGDTMLRVKSLLTARHRRLSSVAARHRRLSSAADRRPGGGDGAAGGGGGALKLWRELAKGVVYGLQFSVFALLFDAMVLQMRYIRYAIEAARARCLCSTVGGRDASGCLIEAARARRLLFFTIDDALDRWRPFAFVERRRQTHTRILSVAQQHVSGPRDVPPASGAARRCDLAACLAAMIWCVPGAGWMTSTRCSSASSASRARAARSSARCAPSSRPRRAQTARWSARAATSRSSRRCSARRPRASAGARAGRPPRSPTSAATCASTRWEGGRRSRRDGSSTTKVDTPRQQQHCSTRSLLVRIPSLRESSSGASFAERDSNGAESSGGGMLRPRCVCRERRTRLDGIRSPRREEGSRIGLLVLGSSAHAQLTDVWARTRTHTRAHTHARQLDSYRCSSAPASSPAAFLVACRRA